MVNLSRYLLREMREEYPDAGITDLKASYRGRRYVLEMIKTLPEKPEAVICDRIIEQISRLGCIHSPHISKNRGNIAA